MSQRSRRTQKSLSQPSTSRAQFSQDNDESRSATQESPNNSLTDQEHAHHVANVVKYILNCDSTNRTILRLNIIKSVNCHGKAFRTVIKTAEEVLLDVFGYELIDKDGKFMLLNTIKNKELHFSEEIGTRYVLLFLTLTHIFMSGDVCTEGSLMNFLINLGIINDGTWKSDVFGDVLHVITLEFVKEKYIEIEKSENNQNLERELKWGDRAHLELSARSVMEFVGKIYGRDIQSWPQQYEKMLKQESNAQKVVMVNGSQNDITVVWKCKLENLTTVGYSASSDL